MNYIRNYYKVIIFDVIKARIDSNNNNPYLVVSEIIIELYSIFREYD